MKNFIFNIFFLAFIFISSSCKKEIETRYVPEYLKKMIPYNQNQKITFSNLNGNLINTQVLIIIENNPISNCSTCDPTHNEESINYKLIIEGSQNNTELAKVELFEHAENYIFYSINSPLDNYSVGMNGSIQTQDKREEFLCSSNQICHDTITINNKLYKNVIEQGGDGGWQYNHLTKVYYSKEKGIIAFDYKEGQRYFLKE